MEQVKQLKAMRDDAWARIRATADYKLATSLDALISDLEAAIGGANEETSEEEGQETEADGVSPYESTETLLPETLTPTPRPTMESLSEFSEEEDHQDEPDSGEEEPAAHEPEKAEPVLSVLHDDSTHDTEPETENAPDDDDTSDVMSELSKMIHAGVAAQAEQEEEAESTTHNGHAAPAPDDAETETKSDDTETGEDEAIRRAMEALDEDLSRSALEGGDDESGSERESEERSR